MMEGPGADSEEKHEPVSDIDTVVVVVVGLKALDPEWPIREAIDPTRHFATVNCRIAKGSLDHLVGNGEQRRRPMPTSSA